MSYQTQQASGAPDPDRSFPSINLPTGYHGQLPEHPIQFPFPDNGSLSQFVGYTESSPEMSFSNQSPFSSYNMMGQNLGSHPPSIDGSLHRGQGTYSRDGSLIVPNTGYGHHRSGSSGSGSGKQTRKTNIFERLSNIEDKWDVFKGKVGVKDPKVFNEFSGHLTRTMACWSGIPNPPLLTSGGESQQEVTIGKAESLFLRHMCSLVVSLARCENQLINEYDQGAVDNQSFFEQFQTLVEFGSHLQGIQSFLMGTDSADDFDTYPHRRRKMARTSNASLSAGSALTGTQMTGGREHSSAEILSNPDQAESNTGGNRRRNRKTKSCTSCRKFKQKCEQSKTSNACKRCESQGRPKASECDIPQRPESASQA